MTVINKVSKIIDTATDIIFWPAFNAEQNIWLNIANVKITFRDYLKHRHDIMVYSEDRLADEYTTSKILYNDVATNPELNTEESKNKIALMKENMIQQAQKLGLQRLDLVS